ncbi:MAG: hybrid sensor histidine kinase/response regulator [Leptolyngbyaceae cyanobacterium MO_188.B28]|nr:hybrid sensor histidine kinase/response regulator [Leptolyngbyaceae cyanobacterium MO_188.B28]
MSIDSEIRDQTYQFFVVEAAELLQTIETNLLTLRDERSKDKVNVLMRAAHSIKGGAAFVRLNSIKELAHRLEDSFRALYSEAVEIDIELEDLLLKAYDCLRTPLMEQIATGGHDTEAALVEAKPIFDKIEQRLGAALNEIDDPILNSTELGVDIILSIFEVDVARGLDHLAEVVENPQNYDVATELRSQADQFSGFAHFLNLPGFGEIAQTTLAALDIRPHQSLKIAQLALRDFQAGRDVVMTGDRTQGGCPSDELIALADAANADEPGLFPFGDAFGSTTNADGGEDLLDQAALESLFGSEESTDSPLNDIDDSILFPEETDTFSPPDISEGIIFPEESDTFSSPDINEGILFPEEGGVASPPNINEGITFPEEVDTFSPPDINEGVIFLEEADIASPTHINDSIIFPEETITPSPTDINDSIPFLDEPGSLSSAANINNSIASPGETDIVSSPNIDDNIILDYNSVDTKEPVVFPNHPSQIQPPDIEDSSDTLDILEAVVQSIEQDSLTQNLYSPPSGPLFENLKEPPLLEDSKSTPLFPIQRVSAEQSQLQTSAPTDPAVDNQKNEVSSNIRSTDSHPTPTLSVRVDLERLERMNNLVGELTTNRNSLALRHGQAQSAVEELLQRFERCQDMISQLRDLSDEMLIAPERSLTPEGTPSGNKTWALDTTDFDSLEMDQYGILQTLLQGVLEDMMQLEEAVEDVALFTGQSGQVIEHQRQMLTQLRGELIWSRMLPLSQVLNRFPRMLRDLSATHHKPVQLKLSGMGVLVDKAVLEKLYDPLLHLLRNAFDHGIEPPEIRRQQGKPEQGKIEIRAYHQGNRTIVEVEDDGQGLNLELISRRAIERGLILPEHLISTSAENLLDLIFEPGFSTAKQVSDISGRGVGLDVVKSQIQSVKGTITLRSTPGQGTIFTLRLPLTLTIAKLIVCLIGSTAVAVPFDGVESIVIPEANQMQQSGGQQFLFWRDQMIPAYRLADLMDYNYPVPGISFSKALIDGSSSKSQGQRLIVLRRGQEFIALAVDQVVTEQELVIKPFGSILTPPNYIYGCTILGDGTPIPVMNGTVLLDQVLATDLPSPTSQMQAQLPAKIVHTLAPSNQTLALPESPQISTVLVVDDSTTIRQALVTTLQKAGYQVMQARDGWEAIVQLRQSSAVHLVICDIEMPNMNGFEFLSECRQDDQLAKIPVAMLTTRGNDKHRALAMHLGATAYFTKPYMDIELLESVKNIIDENRSNSGLALPQSI